MKNHLHKILSLTPDDMVLVHLTSVAQVYLMTGEEYLKYTEDESFQAFGGKAEVSPYRLAVGDSGNWHLVIEQIDSGSELTVRVEIQQHPKAQPEERKVKHKKEELLHNEPLSEKVDIQEGMGGNTFILLLNKRRSIFTRVELRGLVKAAWEGNLPSKGGQAIFAYLDKERRDVLQDVGIKSPYSPVLQDLSALIRSKYVPKK